MSTADDEAVSENQQERPRLRATLAIGAALTALMAVVGPGFLFALSAAQMHPSLAAPVEQAASVAMSVVETPTPASAAESITPASVPQTLPVVTDSTPDPQQPTMSTGQLIWLHDHRMPPPTYLTDQGVTSLPRNAANADVVSLTFDDGPSENTTEIVSILDRYGVHATFFFVGRRAQVRPDAVRAVLRDGSDIGNHTLDHVSLLAQTEAWDQAQVTDAEHVFEQIAGVTPVWVRPQAGWADQTGITAIKRLGRQVVLWNDGGDDTVPEYTPPMIAQQTLSGAKAGSIILLHETNHKMVEALPAIIEGLRAKGFKVESLGEAAQH